MKSVQNILCLLLHMQRSLPLSNCSTGDVWFILDRSSTNRSTRWSTRPRRHRLACDSHTFAAYPELHSAPGWDQGCSEAIARMILNPEYHNSASRARWAVNVHVRVNFMKRTQMETVNFLLNVNISMTVALIITQIGTFVKKRQVFMLFNWNCARLATFWRFSNILRRLFWHGVLSIDLPLRVVRCTMDVRQ